METANFILGLIRALAWPIAVLAIAFLFRHQINKMIWRINKATLPGGISLDFHEEVQKTKELSKIVKENIMPKDKEAAPKIPLTQANARMISLGLEPTPSGLNMDYYLDLAHENPNLALASLRIEIEILSRNLAKGFGIKVDAEDSVSIILKKLYRSDSITYNQMQLTFRVLNLCNAAIHGTLVTEVEAEAIVDIAKVLADQYLSWLSWGFDGEWNPGMLT